MINQLFPPMSLKDRVIGLIGMLVYISMGFFPILFIGLLFRCPWEFFYGSIPGMIAQVVIMGLTGLFAWAWLIEGGYHMITRCPPKPHQGLRPGDNQPWKHGGGW